MLLLKLFRRWYRLRKHSRATKPRPAARKIGSLARALFKAQQVPAQFAFNFNAPDILPGVLPKGVTAAVAMDSNIQAAPSLYLPLIYGASNGFPGFPYLATLSMRAEYRQMAAALSTELTREWISINSSETAGDETKAKITKLIKKIEDIDLKNCIMRAAEHDAMYGRAQILVQLKGHNDLELPLIPSNATIKLDSFVSVKTVEAMWTTPVAYNASDPAAIDFYKPRKWFMLGRPVHATRLMTVITRELPDMLKPSFNFAGISLFQIAEPYVNNWLRARKSVADILSNFSITALRTSMDEVLTGDDDGESLLNRAKLFIATRSNQGIMLLDKEREEIVQVNTPLSGLDKLQAQAQEHMCAVSRLPAVILTGLSPTGLNNSSEEEIRAFYDWIAATQESFWRRPIKWIIDILQISMFGEIDPDISFAFVPLFQMTGKELADIRTADATTAATLIDRQVISPEEERERLARDPESGYQGLSLDPADIPAPEEEEEEEDNEK